jgi:hypothetical protein
MVSRVFRTPARSEPIRPGARALLILLTLGLALRLAVFAHGLAVHPGLLHPDRTAIEAELSDPSGPFLSSLGFEVSNVAWSLVCAGEGFASPFGASTGPTGWVSPGLVAPWALAFALFGCFSTGSVLALFAIAGTASLAMIALAAVTAARLFRSARAGIVAGALAAVSPWDLAVFHAASLLDPNLSPVVALALVAVLVQIADRPTVGVLAGYGVLSGVAVLVNPVLVLPTACGLGVAVLGGVLAGRRRSPTGSTAGRVTVASAGTAVVASGFFVAGQLLLVGPWVLHQHAALGGWSLVKTNLPFEIALGNRPGIDGVYEPEIFAADHPSASREELARYRRLGERAYVEERFDRFREHFDPPRFARATARRAAHALFLPTPRPWQGPWSRRLHALLAPIPGLVLLLFPMMRLRRGGLSRGDAVLYTVVATYLGPYLVVGVTERYLLPLVPLVLVLAAGLLTTLFPPGGSSEGRTRTVSSGSDDGAKRAPVGSGRFS